MTADRFGRAVFVVELLLLALPAIIDFVTAFAAFADLASASALDGGAPSGLGLSGTAALGVYALAFTSFCVLAVRYLVGGGSGVGRVTPVVWTLAVAGQAIAATAAVWTAFFETAPNAVRAVALLTFSALGLFIPLAHMLVAALIARRGQDRPSAA